MVESEKPNYRLLTGEDNDAFCRRVSAALDEGYVLYGSPATTFDLTSNRQLVAQAVVRPHLVARVKE